MPHSNWRFISVAFVLLRIAAILPRPLPGKLKACRRMHSPDTTRSRSFCRHNNSSALLYRILARRRRSSSRRVWCHAGYMHCHRCPSTPLIVRSSQRALASFRSPVMNGVHSHVFPVSGSGASLRCALAARGGSRVVAALRGVSSSICAIR